MPTIEVPDFLYQQLEQLAQQQNTSVDMLAIEHLTATPPQTPIDTLKLGVPDLLPYMVYVENVQQGNHAYVNAYTEEFFGLTLAQMQAVGMQYVRERLHPDDLQELSDLITDWSIVNDDDIIRNEYRLKNQAGEYRWFRVIERVYARNEHGQVTQILGTAIDVHNRKLAEAEARQNSTIYREMAANLPKSAVIVLDRKLRYLVAAGEVLEETGFPSEDVQGKQMHDVLDADTLAVTKSRLEQAFAGERIESVFTYKNGKTYRVTYAPLFDNDDVRHALILITDITNEKDSERKASEAKQQLELAIETAKIGMWHLDLTHNSLHWNQQLYDIYNLTPEALDENLDVWREMVHPEDQDHANAELERISRDERVSNVSFRIVHKNGDIRYINATGAAIKNAQGNITHLMGFNMDVTHIVDAQRALFQVESRYETLFNSAHHHVVVFDKDARIMAMNETGARNIGYEPFEVQGKLIGDIVPSADIVAMKNIKQVLETQTPFQTEDLIQVNGEDVWWWSSVQPIFDEDGVARHVQIISHDITDQKLAQRLTQERDHLQKQLEQEQALVQQRQRMLSVLSHEVKTPLAIIMNSIEFLTTYREHLSPEREEQRLEQIRAQVFSMNELFDDIAQQIKFDQDFMSFAPIATPVTPMLSEFIRQLEPLVHSNQTLEVSLAVTDLELELDERLIYHAISNIISNAIKYSPDGGVIEVHTYIEDDDFVLMSKDMGIGIPPEDIDRILSPFERANNVGQIRGTGIGLAIVREIAEIHGGTVEVTSEQGVGTTVYLRLPINPVKN